MNAKSCDLNNYYMENIKKWDSFMDAVKKEKALYSLEELEFIYTTSYDENEISEEESAHDPVLDFLKWLKIND